MATFDNGSFENGLTGWTVSYSSPSSANAVWRLDPWIDGDSPGFIGPPSPDAQPPFDSQSGSGVVLGVWTNNPAISASVLDTRATLTSVVFDVPTFFGSDQPLTISGVFRYAQQAAWQNLGLTQRVDPYPSRAIDVWVEFYSDSAGTVSTGDRHILYSDSFGDDWGEFSVLATPPDGTTTMRLFAEVNLDGLTWAEVGEISVENDDTLLSWSQGVLFDEFYVGQGGGEVPGVLLIRHPPGGTDFNPNAWWRTVSIAQGGPHSGELATLKLKHGENAWAVHTDPWNGLPLKLMTYWGWQTVLYMREGIWNFRNTAEGGTIGNYAQVWNTGGASGNAFNFYTEDAIFDDEYAAEGEKSYKSVDTFGSIVGWLSEGAVTYKASASMCLRLQGYPLVNHAPSSSGHANLTRIMEFIAPLVEYPGEAGGVASKLIIDGDGYLGMAYLEWVWSTVKIPLNQWVRVEYDLEVEPGDYPASYDPTSGSATVRLYLDHTSNIPDDTITLIGVDAGAQFTATYTDYISGVMFGFFPATSFTFGGTQMPVYWMDDLRLSSSELTDPN